MKPVDGQHRSQPVDEHDEWSRNLFRMLKDGGRWGVPRSGLIYEKQGDTFALVERTPGHDPRYQQEDHLLIASKFIHAGIPVRDDT